MTIIYIEGKQYKVKKSDNILKTCLSLGFDVPYFCWHPMLGSVGSCRQCVVKEYKKMEDIKGKLIVSCMTPVTDGIYISINDNEAKNFRKSIIELLMINHPHDCPVCEEGGHCHLQDMTVMSCHNIRRYRFTKRTHYNQYLGPFISHEMNRCITCYRCVRYYKDYADGCDFGVYGIHDNIYFGRYKEGILENEFSGNLVEICPTGVFTDKTHSQHYNRKWDMQFSPSICQQCCIGCNISPGERYGEIRRIENRYNGSINHYFLCDLGRFGYGYVNLKNRPKKPLQRCGKNWISIDTNQIINNIVNLLHHEKDVIGIGSPRASIESNFSLYKFVGVENFYSGIDINEKNRTDIMVNILQNGGIYTPSLREIEDYDAILVLGEDVTQTGPRISLAIRQAIKGKEKKMASLHNIADWQITAVMNVGQKSKYPLFITNVDRTNLDDISVWSYYASVNDQAKLGFAIAHKIDKNSPKVTDFNISLNDKVDMIVQALTNAYKPLIISGNHSGNETIIFAAANIAFALKNRGNNVGISFVFSSVNSVGLSMIGGKSLDDALDVIEKGKVDSVIILENSLYRYASSVRINYALSKIKNLIIVDHQYNVLHNKANFILSAANYTESSGTLINQEGRAQRFFKVYDPTYYDNKTIIMESWRWLHLLYSAYFNKLVNWIKLDHVINEIVKDFPQLKKIKYASPKSDFRIHGQKLAREPHCYSGRTSMCSNINIHEQRTPQDKDTMFTFSMEGNNLPKIPRQHVAFAWYPGWNSPQSWNKFQNEIGGNLYHGDPGIRLLEKGNGSLDYFKFSPLKSSLMYCNKKDFIWYIAPYWHLFGSEETSQCSFVIKERMPKPYVMINKLDAYRLNINKDKDTLLFFNCIDMEFCLPVLFSDKLSQGQLGLPLGLPGIPPILSGKKVNNMKKVTL